MEPAPILLFVYNRPQHVKRGLASLLQNAETGNSELYVFSDAARSAADEDAVRQVREIVRGTTGFKQVHIIERAENWGLARNVIDGVSTVVNRHGRVIVLEDDLVVSPYFLRFMNEALETYADEPRVGHIQACDFTQDTTLPDTFLIQWTGSWGWATWQRAWTHFNPDGRELLRQLEERRLTRRFDFNGTYGFTRMLRRQTKGKNNSWAIRWNASLFLKDILSLNVGRSLVSNEGLDGSGTNSLSGDPYVSRLWMKPLEVKKISPVEENEAARSAYERYYGRTNNLWVKIPRRLRSMIKGYFRF
ncbi:glycosyl transferase [Prevotella sp. oral taxon 376]|uniref:glycosyltransferase n=1 Tax=Prevotella sp. oral taxon 376 TaxID=712466 RepID=UPI000D1DCAA0|nr:glycosyltransferase [Prevotella sp. oral taxon 376]PTL33958.1 glycosyl transferase [Prevotella sp. oral taxon 376]